MKRIVLAFLLYLLGFGLCYGGSQGVVILGANGSIAFTPLIDDFNKGFPPNFWGGGYYPLNIGSGRVLVSTYDYTQYSGATGASLRVNYNVPNATDWVGMQITLAPVNGTRPVIGTYGYLTFDIKGVSAGQSFKIEMQGAGGTKSHIYLTDYLDGGTSTGWRTVQIPLDAFANFSSVGAMTDIQFINFVFEHDYLTTCGMSTSSTIYIDNLGFSASQLSAVRIDHFGDNYGLNALGGNMGGMGADGTNNAATSFDTINYNAASRGLKVNYNATTSWSGCFFIFGGGVTASSATPHDFSAYNNLKISAAGATGIAPPYRFQIQLQSNYGTSSLYVPIDPNCDAWSVVGPLISSTTWNTYTISLSAFPNLDKTSIKQMNIIFENWNVVAPTGTIYFDDIDFTK